MDTDARVILFALIALEKFAQTSENKLLINGRLNQEYYCYTVTDSADSSSRGSSSSKVDCSYHGGVEKSRKLDDVTSVVSNNSPSPATSKHANCRTNSVNRRKNTSLDEEDVEGNGRKRKRKQEPVKENPLLKLEKWMAGEFGPVQRQVGFCAQWCLDNLCKYLLLAISIGYNCSVEYMNVKYI